MSKEAVKEPKEKRSFNTKKLKYGFVSVIITIVFVAVVVFANLIAGILTEKKNLKLDLTPEKYYNVSQDTIDFVKSLDKDVEIAVMSEKSVFQSSTYPKMVLETLSKYENNSDHINVNFYDITKNPEVVNKYTANYNGTITAKNIVISCGDRVKVLTIDSDLFTYTSSSSYGGGGEFTGYKGEQAFTSAIMSVTDANPKKAAIILGYNQTYIYGEETSNAVNSLCSILDRNGYQLSGIDIVSDNLSPDDYDLVILPAPSNDLSDDCIKKLENFLYNNGNLDKNMVYLADITQRKTPNIDAFLEVWGIEVGGNQVIESDENNIQKINIIRNAYEKETPASAPISSVADEAYSEGLSNTKLPVVAPAARNINLLFDANVDRTTSSLLTTSESSLLYPLNLQESDDSSFDINDLTGETTEAATEAATETATEAATEEPTEFDPDTAQKGQQNVMALAVKTNTDSEKNVHTNNLLVVGGISLVDSAISASSTYNNAEFFINTVNKICGKENGIIIAEKGLESTTIDITASQLSAIQKVVVYVIPLIVIVAGITVFIRRKNR